MDPLKIKEAHKHNIVGFNNSGTPLGFRSQEDLIDLAIMARQSNDEYLLSFFEGKVPSLDELQKEKAKSVVPVIPAPKPANNGEGLTPSNDAENSGHKSK